MTVNVRFSVVLITVVVLIVGGIASGACAQEDISTLVDKGRKALAANNYQEALTYFQQVVQEIQAKIGQTFERYFPAALSGWEAGEIDSQSWAGTTTEGSHSMTNLTREYTRKSDDARCTINISNWPQMIQGIQQSVQTYKQMEAMMNQDPSIKIAFDEKAGWSIMKIAEKDDSSTQIMAVRDHLMVHIQVDRDEMELAEQYLAKIDLSGLGKTVQ